MFAEVSTLRWQVFTGGYVCESRTANNKAIRALSPNTDEHDLNMEDRYPLEVPGLFRQFAATELTEDGIIAFANQWGPLRSVLDYWEEFLYPDERPSHWTWTPEPTEFWFAEIRRMKALVALWDVLKSKGQDLAKVIKIEREEDDEDVLNGRIVFTDAPELRWNFFLRKRERSASIHELPRMCLLELINDSLWGFCSPWLRMGRKPDESTLCVTPHNLNAALWLMFAQEILGDIKLKQCHSCKRYFEVAGQNDRRQRSDKKYCSPKCRAAAFRERTDKAPGGDEQEPG